MMLETFNYFHASPTFNIKIFSIDIFQLILHCFSHGHLLLDLLPGFPMQMQNVRLGNVQIFDIFIKCLLNTSFFAFLIIVLLLKNSTLCTSLFENVFVWILIRFVKTSLIPYHESRTSMSH